MTTTDPPSAVDAARSPRPQILCVMRMPPNRDGHGGSQRAWHLLQSLLPYGDVHFVLMYRAIDRDCVKTPLTAIEPLVASVTRIVVAGWNPTSTRRLGVIPAGLWNLVTMGNAESPCLGAAELASIAARLPIIAPDLVFAGRLCIAHILQSTIDRRLLDAPVKVVDFDDLMSKFSARQARQANAGVTFKRKVRSLIDSTIVARSEHRIARSWHAVSVCTDEDVAILRRDATRAGVMKIPNVVDRRRLPARPADGRFRILFTGNLGFAPNVEGFEVFVRGAWPLVRRVVPDAELTVVGIDPGERLEALARDQGIPLHANVATLEPYYRDCDAVIVPILFGSGTRIKILEAMAYGRPVVSTTVGAEGMGLVHGQHLLIADDMNAFATALATLALDPMHARGLAERAHAFQQAHYTPAAIAAGVATLLEAGSRRAGTSHAHRVA